MRWSYIKGWTHVHFQTFAFLFRNHVPVTGLARIPHIRILKVLHRNRMGYNFAGEEELVQYFAPWYPMLSVIMNGLTYRSQLVCSRMTVATVKSSMPRISQSLRAFSI